MYTEHLACLPHGTRGLLALYNAKYNPIDAKRIFF